MGGQVVTGHSGHAASDNGQIQDLVERAQLGDRSALEELYLIHFDRIYSYLHMSVGSRHDAEDLTTQTFVKMLESIGRFRWRSAPSPPGSSGSRTTWRWITSARAAAAGGGDPEPAGAEENSAEEQALASIGDASLLELIARLSPEQRQVLTLKFVFRFSNGEAAAILDKTEGAVKSLQHRALASLHKHVTR